MPTIERDGFRVAYDERGHGEPAAVLLHGWCCDRGTMTPLADHLARGRRVISVDLRGHGESSPAAGDCSIQALASDVVAVSRALGVVAPLLVGHSLGALVALEVDRQRGHDARRRSSSWSRPPSCGHPLSRRRWGASRLRSVATAEPRSGSSRGRSSACTTTLRGAKRSSRACYAWRCQTRSGVTRRSSRSTASGRRAR